MPGKCGLCMKSILGSYFPFSLLCWVMWWIACAFSQCYRLPIPRLKKVEQVWLEVVSFICHPCLLISTLWGFTGWREVMHKHNAAQQRDALFLSLTHIHTHTISHRKARNVRVVWLWWNVKAWGVWQCDNVFTKLAWWALNTINTTTQCTFEHCVQKS